MATPSPRSLPFRQRSERGPDVRPAASPGSRTLASRGACAPGRISGAAEGRPHRDAACCRTFQPQPSPDVCRSPAGSTTRTRVRRTPGRTSAAGPCRTPRSPASGAGSSRPGICRSVRESTPLRHVEGLRLSAGRHLHFAHEFRRWVERFCPCRDRD